MRNPFEPLAVELDPETEAICNEVCGALAAVADDPWAEPDYTRLPAFGRKWSIAARSALESAWPGCRKQIQEALDQRVKKDPGITITEQGHIFTEQQVREHEGRHDVMTDAFTGEQRWVLTWPSGYYATGRPAYGPREDVAA